MAVGTLRVYLGAAPGVGKTYAMLGEGRRRRERGTDVVVGFVETHGRARTAEQLADLEVVPRRRLDHRGVTFEEMDVDAVLARRPQVALVDELAHTNVPGSRNAKRWVDVRELLDAGIDVVSTVNIQHLESINDVVEGITGIAQRETIPDDVVRGAEQIELVDMTPEALRRRMAHGNVYAPDKVDAALTNYFRPGNLAALRELALLWVADQVDVALEEYRQRHGITEPWETRERVVVALTAAPGTEHLLRRASRVAQRAHGELVGVHVRSQEGLAGPPGERLAEHRRLLEDMGGRYREAAGGDVGAALVDAARAENATQIILGASRRSRWREVTQGSIINRVVRLAGPIDVHVVSHAAPAAPAAPLTRLPRFRRRGTLLDPRRRLAAWLLTLVGLPLLTLGLVQVRDDIGLSTVLVLYLLHVVVTAAVGGTAPAIAAAILGFLAVNWFLTPPFHTWTVAERENVLALVVYLATASIVSALVAVAARRSAQATRANAEAATLAALAGGVAEPDPVPALVAHLRTAFDLDGAAILRSGDGGWVVVAAAGAAPSTPSAASHVEDLGGDLLLALAGRDLAGEDRRVLTAFAANLAAALDRTRLHREAADAAARAEANELRSALLQAVSHDLRTPLAGIKASANSLRQPDLDWSPAETAEFLATIEDETDRLTALVDNLLDMSRVNAGAVGASVRPTSLEEVVPAALASLGNARDVVVDIPDVLPLVAADPTLLERVVANLTDNALTHGDGCAVAVAAGKVADRVLVRVVDRGPGIRPADRERIFQPFQRLDDTAPRRGAGVGLGLAVARGFTRAMDGELSVEDTPGGGTTMVIDLPGRAMTSVLVVDDEPPILRALAANLKARGYEPKVAATGEEALRLAAGHPPDAVVLDLGLPGITGIEVIHGLRGWTAVPIIVLSARGAERDKVDALDAGADDYVTKPFGMDELFARLRAALRRVTPTTEAPVVETRDFTVDLAARTVERDGREIRLTPIEWGIVELLTRNDGKLVTPRQIVHEVWGANYGDDTEALRVHMAHIRRKLEPERSRPRYFLTEPGMGYRFVAGGAGAGRPEPPRGGLSPATRPSEGQGGV